MSFSEFSFGFWRVMQIIILMPALGMLGWFADRFTDRDAVTPRYTLIPFVASILALAWNAGTLFLYKQTKYSGGFVAFIDLLFAGVFIGAVHGLRLIIETNCTKLGLERIYLILNGHTVLDPSLFIDVNKPCAMLEGWFAYGITYASGTMRCTR
jgi:hypothetical protein